MNGARIMSKLRGSLRSWTIWLNTMALALIPLFDYAHSTFQELQPYLGETTYRVLGLVVVLGNIILRFKTSQSLEAKAPPK